MTNNALALNDNNRPWETPRVPHTRTADATVLAAEDRRAISELHLTLVVARGVTHDLVARADGSYRREHRRAISQVHLTPSSCYRRSLKVFVRTAYGIQDLLARKSALLGCCLFFVARRR